MKQFKKFFLFCSGASQLLLKRCPTETGKYGGIGATVFFTGIFAALSAGYALYVVFDSAWIAAGFSLVWGAMIFNLDRFIVSSMRKGKSFWKEFSIAVPRLVMAVILALVISKPLELKIFEKEIDRKLDEKRTAEATKAKTAIRESFPEIKERERKIAVLKDELKAKEIFRDKLQREYDAERFGMKTSATTGLAGIGSNAKKKELQLDEAQKELDRTRARTQSGIDTYEKQIAMLDQSRNSEFLRQKPAIDRYDGLAARIDALSVLSSESGAMNLANIFLVLLFVAIETAPLFVKLISQRGPYDELLEAHERGYINYRIEQVARLDHQTEEKLKAYRKHSDMILQH
ncbi:MAG: DUF4407 domain-containing protein [Bacteroidia bacterium]